MNLRIGVLGNHTASGNSLVEKFKDEMLAKGCSLISPVRIIFWCSSS